MDAYYDSGATHVLRRPVSLVSFLNPLSRAVGRSLAAITGISLVIVDEAVEHRLGASTHEVLPDVGLSGWRRVEASELARLLVSEPSSLLVLGEGALTEPHSRKLVLEHSTLVYLREELGEVLRRLETERSAKLVTLLAEAESIPGTAQEQLEALFGLRGTEYQSAGFALEVRGRAPRHLALEIARRLEVEGSLERI